MSIEVVVPSLPESVADATLVTWHKKAGDAILKDENLVDLETDKVVLEVPALADGILAEIFETEGATVVGGQLIARIEEGSGSASIETPPSTQTEPTIAAVEINSGSSEALSPAVRKLVAEHGLDTTKITATGKGGRITKTDILNHLNALSSEAKEPQTAPAAMAAPAKATAAEQKPTLPSSDRAEQRVPMTRLRAKLQND